MTFATHARANVITESSRVEPRRAERHRAARVIILIFRKAGSPILPVDSIERRQTSLSHDRLGTAPVQFLIAMEFGINDRN